MSRAVLALGANLGDRAAALQGAVDGLARATTIVARSAIFETVPVGGPAQPYFYNAVVIVETARSAPEVLDLAHEIENAAGRVREIRWGPRMLDVDVLSYDDVVSNDAVLTLPHPRAHERAFVLLPWLDADPDAVIPGHGPVAALVDGVETAGVRKLSDPTLRLPEAG